MNPTWRIAAVGASKHAFSRSQTSVHEWIAGFVQVRCLSCQFRRTFPSYRHNRKSVHVLKPLSSLSYGTVPKKDQPWTLNDTSSPQGLQGNIQDDSSTFKLWLENCHRYGLGNCDQQLKEIQSGKKTVEEVLAEQVNLVASIASEYQKQNAQQRETTMQGVQDADRLPDINMPCPQGVQGEDCARFKLWLENCHQFRFGDCLHQLDSYQQGRKTLVQLFEEQDQMIREAASATYQKRMLSIMKDKTDDPRVADTAKTEEGGEVADVDGKPMTAGQKLKNAVKVYGSTVMVFHISISIMSLGFFYTLVSSGIDVVGLLNRLGMGQSLLQTRLAAGTGTFVVAYAVHKLFVPVRLAVTLTCTPLLVRYLRRIGFLKTPPKSG